MPKKSIYFTILLIVVLSCTFIISCDCSVDQRTAVTGVTLNRESAKIPTGSDKAIVATVYPADATNKRVIWSSSDPSVAKVDANGKVTGVAAGSATVTVKTADGGKTASCSVTVKANAMNIPLTLEFPEAGNVTLTKKGNPGEVLYSLDGGVNKAPAPFDDPIAVPADGRISFYRTLENNLSTNNYFTIRCDKECYVYGNVMSLIDASNYSTATEVYYCSFFQLFSANTKIISHPSKDLVLPAKTLAEYCYGYMFLGCTALEDAPTILATTLADRCFQSMFCGCSDLKEAPDLLATTMFDYSCNYMFSDCVSLKEAPELRATTLADSCYDSMFEGCTSLITAPELPATKMDVDCYLNMFTGCTSLATAPELPAEELARHCYYGMFEGCTSLTTAPKLPATTLAEGCYAEMFAGCSKLASITCLATDISADDCTSSWLADVAASGTFIKNPSMSTWPTDSEDGIPSGWTVQDYPTK